jgi:hypothetical protein
MEPEGLLIVPNSLPLDPALSNMNPDHAFTSYFFKHATVHAQFILQLAT